MVKTVNLDGKFDPILIELVEEYAKTSQITDKREIYEIARDVTKCANEIIACAKSAPKDGEKKIKLDDPNQPIDSDYNYVLKSVLYRTNCITITELGSAEYQRARDRRYITCSTFEIKWAEPSVVELKELPLPPRKKK